MISKNKAYAYENALAMYSTPDRFQCWSSYYLGIIIFVFCFFLDALGFHLKPILQPWRSELLGKLNRKRRKTSLSMCVT